MVGTAANHRRTKHRCGEEGAHRSWSLKLLVAAVVAVLLASLLPATQASADLPPPPTPPPEDEQFVDSSTNQIGPGSVVDVDFSFGYGNCPTPGVPYDYPPCLLSGVRVTSGTFEATVYPTTPPPPPPEEDPPTLSMGITLVDQPSGNQLEVAETEPHG